MNFGSKILCLVMLFKFTREIGFSNFFGKKKKKEEDTKLTNLVNEDRISDDQRKKQELKNPMTEDNVSEKKVKKQNLTNPVPEYDNTENEQDDTDSSTDRIEE